MFLVTNDRRSKGDKNNNNMNMNMNMNGVYYFKVYAELR